MSSSIHAPDSAPARPAVQPLWSLNLAARARGLCLAREPGTLLAWDEKNTLYLVNRAGQLHGRTRLPQAVTAAACSDDGSACAAVGARGEIWWLTPDLMPRWERMLGSRALACALDPFGQYLAVSETTGKIHWFDRTGKSIRQTHSPLPLSQLAFVPEEPFLLGCADAGLVACFDLKGQCLWRDGLVTHIGSLAVTGDGSRIALACYSDGVRGYELSGKKLAPLQIAEPCRLAALSFDGRRILVAGMSPQVTLLNAKGQIGRSLSVDSPPVALALSALADTGFAAFAEGRVAAYSFA
jgi:hypothetical protein